jgi:5-methylcytosine-specific restriction endonuclease McrA
MQPVATEFEDEALAEQNRRLKRAAYHKAWHAAHYAANKAAILRKQRAAYDTNRREKKRAYREANRDRFKARDAAYVAAHKEQTHTRHAAYVAAHPEETRTYQAAYRLANKESKPAKDVAYRETHKAEWRVYRATHRALFRAVKQRQRARKYQASINDFTAAQWREMQEAYDHCCAYCDERHKGKLSQDHLTPLSQGGAHTVSNIIPACRRCNSKKRTGNVLKPVQPMLLTEAAPRRRSHASTPCHVS